MPKITDRPFTLTTGLLVYLLLDLALLGVAANTLFGDAFTGAEAGIAAVIGGTLAAGAVIVAIEVWRASRGKRSARTTLTYLTAILVMLYVWRRLMPFLVLAVLGAVGLLLVWMPASGAFFQRVEPRRQRLRGYARATSKAARTLRGRGNRRA